jgi:twitching motility protein PilT
MPNSDLHDVLKLAIAEGASDVHVREGFPAMLRISGKLAAVEGYAPGTEEFDAIIPQICSENDRARFDEHGDADFAHVEEDVGRFRVNLHKQRGTRSLSLRHIKPKVPQFSELGLPDVIKDVAASPRGIILVTGTTGSGKSTTLAAMLEHMNDHFKRRVITIEDPIEFDFKDRRCIFEQREVGLDTSSFDSALIHALRQDPDVIVVGEMRNSESFDTALAAADTGHLVLSTLHTSNASQSIQRILDFYEEADRDQIRRSLGTTLRAIISQRLVPRADGTGRVPAVEVMTNAPIVRKLITEGRLEKLPQAIETGGSNGMMSYNQSILKLMDEKLITEDDALEASTSPEQLRMNLQGIFLTETSAIVG